MLTTREAAEQLGITRRSVARLCNENKIKAEKRGRDYFIDQAEIDRYALERKPAHRPKKKD